MIKVQKIMAYSFYDNKFTSLPLQITKQTIFSKDEESVTEIVNTFNKISTFSGLE